MKRSAFATARQLSVILLLWMTVQSVAQDAAGTGQCPMVKIEAERMPDLNIPRCSHSVFFVNGEVTVVGGHTTNFEPTATAEYYKDGKWHLVNTAYTHDNGVSVLLSSGKVLLGGGSEKPLGIGQTFPVEEYSPSTHTFRGFSCFETKRALAGGIELDSGRVVICGNWHHGDSIEVFDGDRHFYFAREPLVHRASPYIFRIAPDDVLILGNGGTHCEPLLSDVADRLKGQPLHVPLLRRWQPLFFFSALSSSTGFIGDESKGDYSWLMPVEDWTEGDSTLWDQNRQLAFMLVSDTTFTLLPTTCPVPKTGLGGKIYYCSPVLADRQAQRAYVHGIDKDNRHYLLCADYAHRPAPITLYYTDPLPQAGFPHILLDDNGDLWTIGGLNYNFGNGGTLVNDNFSPLASVYRLHIGQHQHDAAKSSTPAWVWPILIAVLLLTAIYIIILWRRRRKPQKNTSEASATEPSSADKEPLSNGEELISRILTLMEQEQLYLDSGLNLANLASRLNTNRNAVSACINSNQGCSFSQFIGTYRVEHAKKLMRQLPEMKMTEVWMSSGFTTESSFFRTFKTVTGMTPSEWKVQNN